MERIIGVVAPAAMGEDPNPRKDVYLFGNNYGNRIYDKGGIPLGILPSDGRVPEKVLEKMDAFVICGGHKFWPYHLQVVHHAVTTGKPLLGICLGMQSIYSYFRAMEYREATGRYDEDIFVLHQERRAQGSGLHRVEGHLMEHLRGHEEETKQPVHLVPGSLIHRLTGKDTIMAGSFHNFVISPPPAPLTVTGTASDGTIDVIEYGEKILGVQFHPEIDRELLPIFDVLFQ